MKKIGKGALLYVAAFLAATALTVNARATTWFVGPTRSLTTPCQAIAIAAAGDTIMIDYSPSTGPGVGYYDDTCAWTTNNLTLIGVLSPSGARPVLNCAGLTDTNKTGHLANHKAIWDPSGSDTVVENLEFENATLNNADGANGAGIRVDGQNLTVLNCYFHNNQDGILESNIAGSNIVIKNSEFYQNGVSKPKLRAGYGFTHNLYIGHCASLLFEYNFTHDANVGHLLKSRAAVNYILYNRITGENGTDSYEIDLPNGGTSYVVGNEIQQGPNTGNSTILSYLEEGTNSNNPGLDLYVGNNTFVNQFGSGTVVVADSPAVPAPSPTRPIRIWSPIFRCSPIPRCSLTSTTTTICSAPPRVRLPLTPARSRETVPRDSPWFLFGNLCWRQTRPAATFNASSRAPR